MREKVRVTVALPLELWKKLAHECVERRMRKSQLIISILTEYFEKIEKERGSSGARDLEK